MNLRGKKQISEASIWLNSQAGRKAMEKGETKFFGEERSLLDQAALKDLGKVW